MSGHYIPLTVWVWSEVEVGAARWGGWAAGGRPAVRWAYAACALALIVGYPFLSDDGRAVDFRVAALAAIPAVVVGSISAGTGLARLPRWVPLLLAGLIIVNVANAVRLAPGVLAGTSSGIIDALGNVVMLVAALTLVIRCGRGDFGGVIDTAIIALAVGGLIWDFILLPYEQAVHSPVATEVDLFIVVFALAGVLGALIRVAHTNADRSSALWLLMAALMLALVGNIVQAVSDGSWLRSASTMMFIGAYAGVGLFGLDPAAYRLVGPETSVRDNLSARRLLFLGLALAVMPVAFGVNDLFGGHINGALLVLGGGVVTALVMLRISRLSSERDRAERILKHLATHDPLTSLLNRREFVSRLRAQLSRPSRTCVAFVDLDGFKEVNDRRGHAEGDRLLIEVAKRLVDSVRETDIVARLGGDEFLIMLNGAAPGNVDGILDRVSAALSRPIELGGETVRIGASIGLADSTEHTDPDELIRRADLAMYRAKSAQPETPTVRLVAV